jgi:lipid II:glycine glycyltransferase (peptidoglycan interpeptide bridge formation enzyme)
MSKMIEITKTQDKDLWERFIDDHCITTFMQSWSFGVFEENIGYKVYRLLITDKNVIEALCQVIIVTSKKAKYVFVPHGPIFKSEAIPKESYLSREFFFSEVTIEKISSIFFALADYLRKIAKEQKCSYIRFNTSLPNNTLLRNRLYKLNIIISPIYYTSENSAVLDLTIDDPESIIKLMRKSTRQIIKKFQTSTEENAVKIVQLPKDNFLKVFEKLYIETIKREKFTGFSTTYIKKEFEAFEKDRSVKCFVAYVNKEPVSAGLFIKTKNALFYHQGASNHKNSTASHILQWSAIQSAIASGCKYHSFWGTHIPGRTPKSWMGLTTFKMGFGTETWSYLPSFDIVIDHWHYWPVYLAEYLIRFLRGV